jgi:hypothetical protein
MAKILIFIAGAILLVAMQDVLPKWALGGGLFALFAITGVGNDSMYNEDGPTPSWVWGARLFLLVGAGVLAVVGYVVWLAIKK